jgi:hypothetical protein
MRFKLQKKKYDLFKVYIVFCWCPRIIDGYLVWLENVYRKKVSGIQYPGYYWEYHLIEELSVDPLLVAKDELG